MTSRSFEFVVIFRFNGGVVSQISVSGCGMDGKEQVMFEIRKNENTFTNTDFTLLRNTISHLFFLETSPLILYVKFWY